ncbi:C-GCAxxG-C-C family protein [Eggerthella guodeyinii]|uniref:C_GCAxxG_C_C family protein n=1 Tax=Eggerthella guodeyinii TaxID=2690837 RepID=A0A6N7RPD9_9ACTN|nr:C-GCAxxG-C-C family protein [Eggerthella guodeyinii]MRX82847.1 hypothetical protein [Eggerthella guodeyinii]
MTNADPRTAQLADREALDRRALELHGMNYNCAQAVACTLASAVRADEDQCFRAAEALGAGMGGLTETCGALTGAAMIIGLANSNGKDDPTSKQGTYRIMRKLVADFRAHNGSTLCPELKGIKTKQPLRSCNDCILDALHLAADALATDAPRANAR